MDFSFSPEQVQFRAELRAWLERLKTVMRTVPISVLEQKTSVPSGSRYGATTISCGSQVNEPWILSVAFFAVKSRRVQPNVARLRAT